MINLDKSLKWHPVCTVDDIARGGGVAVLVSGLQIAVFHTDAGQFHALDNRDPYTGTNVISRGILGSKSGVATISSPMLKHAFALETGESLDNPVVGLATYPIRINSGMIEIG